MFNENNEQKRAFITTVSVHYETLVWSGAVILFLAIMKWLFGEVQSYSLWPL